MKIKNVTNEIALLTLHPNKILRREAQLALVKIEGFKALEKTIPTFLSCLQPF